MSRLLIFGASARAAAMSAVRAGLSPWCADLFADADLRRLCPAVAVTNYPHAFAEVARGAPPGPWLYTGALENHPKLVAKISERRELWGNHAEVLRRVRSPRVVAEYLLKQEMPVAALWEERTPPREERRWLVKPVGSGGGNRIAFWKPGGRSVPAHCYLQEFIEGDSCAALFVGFETGAVFLGATQQLVGWEAVHAKPFSYCGSIGPLVLSDAGRSNLQKLGDSLAREFHLRGLFGIDCILRDDLPYPVEVNPRYTASVEVLELALGFAALKLHAQACQGIDAANPVTSKRGEIIGKAILFAKQAFVFPEKGPWQATLSKPFEPGLMPACADIPCSGQFIQEGQPILTVFAGGPTQETCRDRLAEIADSVYREL